MVCSPPGPASAAGPCPALGSLGVVGDGRSLAELAPPGALHPGLLWRYRPGDGDGIEGGEGAFTACGFWLAEALALAGRHAEAQDLLAGLADLAGDLRISAEETGPWTCEQLGNLPQALTHIGLINAALSLYGDGRRARPAQGSGSRRRGTGQDPAASPVLGRPTAPACPRTGGRAVRPALYPAVPGGRQAARPTLPGPGPALSAWAARSARRAAASFPASCASDSAATATASANTSQVSAVPLKTSAATRDHSPSATIPAWPARSPGALASARPAIPATAIPVLTPKAIHPATPGVNAMLTTTRNPAARSVVMLKANRADMMTSLVSWGRPASACMRFGRPHLTGRVTSRTAARRAPLRDASRAGPGGPAHIGNPFRWIGRQ